MSAAQCDEEPDFVPPTCVDNFRTIANQTQLKFYSSCPNLDAFLFVGHCYPGSFELPGVKSIARITAGWNGPVISGDRQDDPVTSISFPDLENITISIQASYLNHLTNLSFP